ncbi:GumC family protein [Hydrogenophaga sp.]|uniref:GumC family protein n=1 Tax=Hydrogenophaga sp. TaxID=1904254 RepID=UPI003D15212C
MSTEYQLSLPDYVAIARRWAAAGMLVFCLVLAGSVVVAMLLPRVYESTATLLTEGPQVSGEVVRSTIPSGNAEQRIQAISQRIMTRENLLRVAADHQVFESKDGAIIKDSDIVNAMRGGIAVRVRTTGNLPPWERTGSNFVFDVSFQHGKPEKALEVTNALVQLFLEASTLDRVKRASQTNEFLTQEAERVQAQLEELERRIAAYKRTQGAGAGDQAVAVANIQSLESDLRAVEREHRQALDELRTLEVDLVGARSGVTLPGTEGSPGASAAEQELERANAELARLRSRYTDNHPDVRAQRRQIEMLQRTARADAGAGTPAREAAVAQMQLVISRLEARVATARARVDLLSDQQRNLRGTIAQLRAQVSRAPQIERDLAVLQRDHDAARIQYQDLRSKQLSAQVVENLEDGRQGERFSLLEPALMPEYPVKPSRKKIVAQGFIVALAAGAGAMALLEFLFARVRGINAVTALTGQRPMVVIPYIETRSEVAQTWSPRKRALVAATGLAGVLGLVAVHVLITPLHTLLISLFSRSG